MTPTDQIDYPSDLFSDAVRADLVPNLDVVPAELDRYRREGFLGVRSVFGDRQVRAALDGLSSLLVERPDGVDIQFEEWATDRLEQLDGAARLDLVRRFMWFTGHDERLRALACDPRLLDAVRAIIGGGDVVLFQDMALLKPPGGGREKPWHQDNAFFRIRPGTPIVGVWIALDEATVENGCMHVLPGTHREGPVIHFRRRDWQICDTDVQTARDVAVPLPPGGALLFDGLIHHGTPPNRTDTRRRALQFHYVARSAARTTEDERLETFGSEGKDVSC